jgi:hypothetical protein
MARAAELRIELLHRSSSKKIVLGAAFVRIAVLSKVLRLFALLVREKFGIQKAEPDLSWIVRTHLLTKCFLDGGEFPFYE